MELMGRLRQSNRNLPPRLHFKTGVYYYVTSDKPRKWIRLSKDLSEARVMWAEIENGTKTETSLSTLIDEWLSSPRFKELSANTQRQYISVSKQLKSVFADFQVQDIKPHHIAQWQDNHSSPVQANTGKSVLVNVLQSAVRKGLIERNHAREVDNLKTKRRKVYLTDEQYLAIKQHAHPVLQAAMGLAYVTGARIDDILSIKLSQWTQEGLMIRQKKTDKLQLFKRSIALELAIETAKAIKRPARGIYLLCNEQGHRYAYNTVSKWWRTAREKAGIEDAKIHDIRGKAATDAKMQGMDYQALLGHTTKAMSDSYIKLEEAQVVEPMKKIL